MIRQQVGDLLEIESSGNFYYLVVLTKIVMFGGNIVFAYHGDGKRKSLNELLSTRKGFNICTDILPQKREGNVSRLHKFETVSDFWKTKFVKATNEYRKGHKAQFWYIYRVSDLAEHIEILKNLPQEYREAMDSGMYGFDLTARKILNFYTPEQNIQL